MRHMSMPPPPMTVMPPTQPPAAPSERSALGRVLWFSILQIVGLVAGWAAGFYLFGPLFGSASAMNLGPNPTPADVAKALGPLFQAIVLIVPISAVISIVGLLLLTSGFRGLSKSDSRFSLPSIFMIIMIIGYVLAVVGVVPLVNDIPNLIAQAPTTGNAPSSAFATLLSTLIFSIALIGLGGLLAFIGLIGGMILGLWRVGSKYDETLIKIGAIFIIIPLLNIVAPILILVGVSGARGRLGSQVAGA